LAERLGDCANVIDGCKIHNCKLVYFDNTYAYPQDISIQTEETPMTSEGKKKAEEKTDS
jgi:hypothetical protein